MFLSKKLFSFGAGLLIAMGFCQAKAGGPHRVTPTGEPISLGVGVDLKFHIDSGALNESFSNLEAKELARQAFEAWSQIPGSALVISENTEPGQDYASLFDIIAAFEAGRNPVVFDADGSLLASVGYGPETPGVGLPFNYDGTRFVNFFAVFNGPALEGYSAERLKGLMIQVFGGSLGLSFSSVNGPLVGAPSGPVAEGVEMMFPNDFGGARAAALKADDISGFLALYGSTPQGASGLGAVSGTVWMSNGIDPAGGVNIIARRVDDPFAAAYSTLTDASSGAFKIVGMTPGEYTIETADIGNGVPEDSRAIHGLAIRTDYDLELSALTIDRAHRARLIGPFPGEPEFYSGAAESNDPVQDPASAFEAVTVNADQTAGDIRVVFNRDASKPWTRLIYPWISNREGQFESVVLVNNYSDECIEVELTGLRQADPRESETTIRTIPAHGFLEERASTLFPQLGSGSGYSVLLTAPTDQIRGRWVTNSLQAASKASPSQGVAVRVPEEGEDFGERVGKRLLIGYLPAGSDLISSSVLVSLDRQPVDVTLRFYNQAGLEVGQTVLENQHPFQPVAKLTNDFISVAEDVFVIAETTGAALTGVAFVFDLVFLETAIGNASALAVGESTGETLVFPWISNRAGQFESALVVNNLENEAIEARLTARRQGGQSETAMRTIAANGFLLETASSLFEELGDGAGYAVEVAASGRIAGQWVTNNLASASGRSPSLGVAVSRDRGPDRSGRQVMLGYLPLMDAVTSAPVVVNLGEEPADVTLEFFDRLGNLILKDETSLRNLQPLEPAATLANLLLPDATGNVYAVATCETQPITAVVFVFNKTFLEPAIGNASSVALTGGNTAYAFTDVNLVPMDSERVIPGQTALIRDAKIIAIGDAVDIPADATVIDGAGKYLMPGLNDAHTHIAAVGDLALLLANGVTGVLNMGDFAHQTLDFKRRVKAGEIDGPSIYAAQFLRDPSLGLELELAARNGDEARKIVRDSFVAGYDYLKLYTGLSEEVLYAAADEAELLGFPIVGHLQDRRIPLGDALGAGQKMVAHVEEYLNGFFEPAFNEAQIPAAIETTRAHGAYVATTLSIIEALSIYSGGNIAGHSQLLARPGVEFVEPWERDVWNFRFAVINRDPDFLQRQLAFIKDVGKAFVDAGVLMLTGTDAPFNGLPSGFALHDELRLLGESGWTPYQALQAATKNFGDFVAETVAEAEPFGTVTVGSRADLLLLNSNPLDSTLNAKDRVGVMVRGKWFTEAQLKQMMEDVKSSYQESGPVGRGAAKTCPRH